MTSMALISGRAAAWLTARTKLVRSARRSVSIRTRP